MTCFFISYQDVCVCGGGGGGDGTGQTGIEKEINREMENRDRQTDRQDRRRNDDLLLHQLSGRGGETMCDVSVSAAARLPQVSCTTSLSPQHPRLLHPVCVRPAPTPDLSTSPNFLALPSVLAWSVG